MVSGEQNTFTAKEIMAEAADTLDERGLDYGHPAVNIRRIANLWATYFGREIDPLDVCICMALVKVSRIVETPNRDSFVDLVSYAALAGESVIGDWDNIGNDY
ncbi:MAG: hypothetical protein EBR30_17155 [Cytophagia bacterium]|nr:hypothetical protein [Cytophagia bacterium]NBW36712.1 hypothetical protein [Cytophagia bacterium]